MVPEKHWILKTQASPGEIEALQKQLKIDWQLVNLLIQRRISTYEEARKFFSPDLAALHDPFLMRDMDMAVERIEKAIQNEEKILIYGDYDVDGTTSVALLYTFFKNFSGNLDFYIPERYSEGYGISYKGIDYAEQHGYSLIIALDCGIKAVDKVAYAGGKGIDFIICDHHTPGNRIPDAVAVLDPKRPGCDYPFKELSGCGVGFKLIHAFALRNEVPFDEIVPCLDLVAVSIASDIVPIIAENRVLAYYGLRQLNDDPRTGLRIIIQLAGMDKKKIGIEDIIFRIGPRINAAGRIESGRSSVRLLVAEDEHQALLIGEKVNAYNRERRHIDNDITQKALAFLQRDPKARESRTTVLYHPDWHKGVIGIVASRLIDYYYRPTVILTESNGLATGSARSVFGFDLYSAIDSCSALLENFGGHKYAAGLTMNIQNVQKFREKFEQVVAETIAPEQTIPVVGIDSEIGLAEITSTFFENLKQFEPFGPENMAPVFLTENVVDNGTGKKVGSTGNHLKLNLIQEEDPFRVFPAIAFQQGHQYKRIRQGKSFDICYSIEKNEYMGKKTLQLNIKDIKTD